MDGMTELEFIKHVAAVLSEGMCEIADALGVTEDLDDGPGVVIEAARRAAARIKELEASAKTDRDALVAVHKLTRGIINGTGPRLARGDA